MSAHQSPVPNEAVRAAAERLIAQVDGPLKHGFENIPCHGPDVEAVARFVLDGDGREARLADTARKALNELEGLAIHMNLGPIGDVVEWRYTGRDAARIALDRVGIWRADLAAASRAEP